jgi:hypothetical protein
LRFAYHRQTVKKHIANELDSKSNTKQKNGQAGFFLLPENFPKFSKIFLIISEFRDNPNAAQPQIQNMAGGNEA